MEMTWRDWDRQPGDRLAVIVGLFRRGGAQTLTGGFGVEKKQVRKTVERIRLLCYGGREWRTGDKDNECLVWALGRWGSWVGMGSRAGREEVELSEAGGRGEALCAAGCVRLRSFGLGDATCISIQIVVELRSDWNDQGSVWTMKEGGRWMEPSRTVV